MTGQFRKVVATAALIAAWPVGSGIPADLTYASEAPSVVKATFSSGAQSSGWIDFEFYRDRLVFIPVKMNGHDAVALFLIGSSSSSVVDAAFATALSSPPEQAAATRKGSGPAGGKLDGLKLEVGELTVQGISTAVKDLSAQAATLGHPYSVFLSDDLLQGVVLDIDFPHRRLAFRDPASTVKPAGAQTLSLARLGVGYSVPVSVENAKPALFHVEFGNSSPLMVTRPYALGQKWLEGRRGSQRYTGPTKEPEGMITLTHIVFAGVDFRQMPTVVVPDSLFDPRWFDSDRLSGILGMPLLARYRLVFDFTRDRLYALANAKVMHQSFDKDRFGAILLKGQVTFVAPNSPAQLSGIKVGDKIALINGKPAEAMTDADAFALYDAPAGTRALLTMNGGEVRQLTLAEYY